MPYIRQTTLTLSGVSGDVPDLYDVPGQSTVVTTLHQNRLICYLQFSLDLFFLSNISESIFNGLVSVVCVVLVSSGLLLYHFEYEMPRENTGTLDIHRRPPKRIFRNSC